MRAAYVSLYGLLGVAAWLVNRPDIVLALGVILLLISGLRKALPPRFSYVLATALWAWVVVASLIPANRDLQEWGVAAPIEAMSRVIIGVLDETPLACGGVAPEMCRSILEPES